MKCIRRITTILVLLVPIVVFTQVVPPPIPPPPPPGLPIDGLSGVMLMIGLIYGAYKIFNNSSSG